MFARVALLLMLALPAHAGEALVFGGTGRLGSEIVAALRADGHAVSVFARPTSDRARLAGMEVEWLTGDLRERDSVVSALQGRRFDYVVDASARSGSPPSFYATAMAHMLAALDADSVGQFILHGSVGAGDNREQFPGKFNRMPGVMEAKGEAERLLRESGIPYTIIRNGVLRPAGTPATGTARLTADTGMLGTVTRADLAVLTVRCLDDPDCLGRTLHAVDDAFR